MAKLLVTLLLLVPDVFTAGDLAVAFALFLAVLLKI
jgi:hypothetical protein